MNQNTANWLHLMNRMLIDNVKRTQADTQLALYAGQHKPGEKEIGKRINGLARTCALMQQS